MDDASCFLVIRLGPKRSECEKNVTVVSTVTSCGVTNCAATLHGFNKQASSARLCQIREAPLVALRKIHKIYACSHVSVIRLVHFTIGSD